MIGLLALMSYLNANFAMKYLLWYIWMIFFMLFFIFILIWYSILTPVDTLNLVVRCSPSYGKMKCCAKLIVHRLFIFFSVLVMAHLSCMVFCHLLASIFFLRWLLLKFYCCTLSSRLVFKNFWYQFSLSDPSCTYRE